MVNLDRDFSLGKSEVTPELLADVGVSLDQLQQWQERLEGWCRELQGQGFKVELSRDSDVDGNLYYRIVIHAS